MYSKLTKEEKLAVIGVFKFVVNANGKIDEGEIEAMQEFVKDKGIDDFADLLNDFENNYTNIEDLFDLLAEVDEENRDIILEEAFELAVSDGYATPEELKIFEIIAEAWKVDKDELLEQVSGER